ncbi:MAG TPA: hypothetical protein VGJ45_21850 [Pseudonocardiaceae bacterium]
MSGKFKIDDAYVGDQGQQWANMPNAIKQFADYSAFNGGSPGDGLKAEDFGGTPNAASAAKALLTLMQGLDTSLAKVGNYCQAMSTAFTNSAKSTSETDSDNAMHVTASGKEV